MNVGRILLLSLSVLHFSWGGTDDNVVDGITNAVKRSVVIKVCYNASNEFLHSDYKLVSMWLHGTSMGSIRDKGIKMHQNGSDMWYLMVNISQTRDFVFRISLANNKDMLGANFIIPLPPSTSFQNPTAHSQIFTVYPWFFSKRGTLLPIYNIYSPELGEERKLRIYTPPSFTENQYKQYETLFFNDGQDVNRVVEIVEDLIIEKAAMREIIIVGITNSGDERSSLLAATNGTDFRCQEGSSSNYCNSCLNCTRPNCSYEEILIDMVCYVFHPIPQVKGETYLDFIQHTLISHTQSAYRARPGREHVTIAGFSMGGLLSCHALWTRPHVFGSALCMSPSLWWPFPGGDNIFPDDCGYEFERETLKTNRGVRPRQKLYIDVGSEEGAIMIGPARNVTRMLLETPHFVLDDNLWFYIWQHGYHGFDDIVKRYWLPLLTMYGTGGGSPWSQDMTATSATDIHHGHLASSYLVVVIIQLYMFLTQ